MRYIRFILFIGVIIGMLGCDGNELRVTSIAGANVRFQFRAKEYLIAPNETIVLKDIPSASYAFTTTFTIHPSADFGVGDSSLAGIMDFYARSTQVSMLYSSHWEVSDDSIPKFTYFVHATKTTTHPTGGCNPTSAE